MRWLFFAFRNRFRPVCFGCWSTFCGSLFQYQQKAKNAMPWSAARSICRSMISSESSRQPQIGSRSANSSSIRLVRWVGGLSLAHAGSSCHACCCPPSRRSSMRPRWPGTPADWGTGSQPAPPVGLGDAGSAPARAAKAIAMARVSSNFRVVSGCCAVMRRTPRGIGQSALVTFYRWPFSTGINATHGRQRRPPGPASSAPRHRGTAPGQPRVLQVAAPDAQQPDRQVPGRKPMA